MARAIPSIEQPVLVRLGARGPVLSVPAADLELGGIFVEGGAALPDAACDLDPRRQQVARVEAAAPAPSARTFLVASPPGGVSVPAGLSLPFRVGDATIRVWIDADVEVAAAQRQGRAGVVLRFVELPQACGRLVERFVDESARRSRRGLRGFFARPAPAAA